jgi:S1-C subfamily serine protease
LGKLAVACGVAVLTVCAAAEAIRADQPPVESRLEERDLTGIGAKTELEGALRSAPRRSADSARSRRALPSDDGTFRPTVLVRRGKSQGTGTIIASVEGDTLVLTAAHVVRDRAPVIVEFHRYNLGLEKAKSAPGPWPRAVHATVLATDRAADLAILRIAKLRALPYVARLAREHANPPADSIVSSIGIDLGTKLTGWSTRLVETFTFELNGHREQRPFLITEKIPEHGRSGGGLYLASGELVGVCIGHAALVRGREMGIFASRESIRILLSDRKLNAVIARSESLRARSRGRSQHVTTAAHQPSSSGGTSARSDTKTQPVTGDPGDSEAGSSASRLKNSAGGESTGDDNDR